MVVVRADGWRRNYRGIIYMAGSVQWVTGHSLALTFPTRSLRPDARIPSYVLCFFVFF